MNLNRGKLHILLYCLLIIYILISLLQYYHLKEQISEKLTRVENLISLSNRNKQKIAIAKKVNDSYLTISEYLDSIEKNSLKKNLFKIEKITKQKITRIEKSETKKHNSDNVSEGKIEHKKLLDSISKSKTQELDSEKQIDSVTVENLEVQDLEKINDSLKSENENSQEKQENDDEKLEYLYYSYFFSEIVGVYSSLKNPNPITFNDKSMWIAIESSNNDYRNSIKNIIKEIKLNQVPLRIKEVREKKYKKGDSFFCTYYIKVKIPKKVLSYGNEIIIYADRIYSKRFRAYNR